jgi:hypothetical protein
VWRLSFVASRQAQMFEPTHQIVAIHNYTTIVNFAEALSHLLRYP